jgi:deoxyribonuclease-4
MPIQIGVAGIPVYADGFEDGLRWLSEHGLAEEVQFVRQVYMTRERAKSVRELNESLKVPLSVHAPYYINLTNPEKSEASKKRILDSCDRAELMGADIVVVHAGYYGSDKQKAIDLITKACWEISKKISVKLGLETMGRQKQFGTLEEVLELCAEVKNCIPVIDFAHIFARNDGSINYGRVLDKVRHLKHIHSHFTGVAYSKGNEKHHLPITSKKPDFSKLVTELKKRKTDIRIICEAPVPARDALLMKKLL